MFPTLLGFFGLIFNLLQFLHQLLLLFLNLFLLFFCDLSFPLFVLQQSPKGKKRRRYIRLFTIVFNLNISSEQRPTYCRAPINTIFYNKETGTLFISIVKFHHICPLVPLHLFVVLLLPSLSLHLLHLNGVGFAAAHVQFMVAHAQSQDALVDAQPRSVEYKVL